jgi:hypothetical protein
MRSSRRLALGGVQICSLEQHGGATLARIGCLQLLEATEVRSVSRLLGSPATDLASCFRANAADVYLFAPLFSETTRRTQRSASVAPSEPQGVQHNQRHTIDGHVLEARRGVAVQLNHFEAVALHRAAQAIADQQ